MQSAPQSLCIVYSSLSVKPCWLHSILLVKACFHFGTCLHPTTDAGECSGFNFKCKNGDCVNKVNAECDRVSDCSDNSDETICGKARFNLFPPPYKIQVFKKLLQVDLISSLPFRLDWRNRVELHVGLSVRKEPQALTALFISFFFESSSCYLWSFFFFLLLFFSLHLSLGLCLHLLIFI